MGPSVPVLPGLMGTEPCGLPIWAFGGLGVPGEGPPLTGESSSSRSSCLELKDVLELSKLGIIFRGTVSVLWHTVRVYLGVKCYIIATTKEVVIKVSDFFVGSMTTKVNLCGIWCFRIVGLCPCFYSTESLPRPSRCSSLSGQARWGRLDIRLHADMQ